MKSLIYGLLLTYFLQNSRISVFLYNGIPSTYWIISERPYHRKYQSNFHGCYGKIESRYDPMVVSKKDTERSDPPCSDKVLFFHIPFHSTNISRQKIRDIYEKTCEGEPQGYNFNYMHNNISGKIIKISQLTIAYSRPKNLRDYLCPGKLPKVYMELVVGFFIFCITS